MHGLDHRAVMPLCAALKRRYEAACCLQFFRIRHEEPIDDADLVRVDHRLSVETQRPALTAFGSEASRVIEPVEHAIEHRAAGGTRGKDDRLKRE